MMRTRPRWMLVLVCALTVTACNRTFKATAMQPNPLVSPHETLRASEPITIVTGDMELRLPQQPGPSQRVTQLKTNRYPLQNIASFVMVSRDRLRFHVQLEHKWQEWADLRTWEVEYDDSLGRHFVPEATEHAATRHVVSMWDQEVRSVRRNQYGDVVAINEDGWKRRMPLGSLSVFRGEADVVFYKRDLFTRDLRWIKLTVRRPGQAFEFTWHFDEAGTQIAHRD